MIIICSIIIEIGNFELCIGRLPKSILRMDQSYQIKLNNIEEFEYTELTM